ncbi:MAG: DUF502 domain-containing protein [Nanohaloarchaea archaeon]|nr:DUF502 domain-containing protein [Candidatus Nanohaloarchaea archaeon]
MRYKLKNSFITGAIILAPLAVTIFVLKLVFTWALGIINPIVINLGLARYTANIELVAQLLTGLTIITLVTFIGLLAASTFGRRILGGGGRAINLIPLVRTIYFSVRHLANSMVEKSRYQRVVLVEYPREGIESIGFVTGDSPEELGEKINIFIPQSPNPTAGHLIIAEEDNVEDVDISVKEGLKLVMTTGIREDKELPLEIQEDQN